MQYGEPAIGAEQLIEFLFALPREIVLDERLPEGIEVFVVRVEEALGRLVARMGTMGEEIEGANVDERVAIAKVPHIDP